ncbi:reverse transcriptase domain-containing protein [Tanacetum coccineum]
MRTRRSNYSNSNVTIPRRRRRQVSNIVEPEIRTIVAPMRSTMKELLLAPKGKVASVSKNSIERELLGDASQKASRKVGDPDKFLIPCNFPGIEYAPELLGFPNTSGGNPTSTSKPFTFKFILEEIEAYLKDDSISPEIDHADWKSGGHWNLPFELMCDASDFAIGAVLGQRKMKHFQPIHYANKTMTEGSILTLHGKGNACSCICFYAKPRLLRTCRGLKSFDGVDGKEVLSPQKLAMQGPRGHHMPIAPLEKYLMPVSFGLPYIEMPIQ